MLLEVLERPGLFILYRDDVDTQRREAQINLCQ